VLLKNYKLKKYRKRKEAQL